MRKKYFLSLIITLLLGQAAMATQESVLVVIDTEKNSLILLPNEILEEIFFYLSKLDLIPVTLVNKSLNVIANRFIKKKYQHISKNDWINDAVFRLNQFSDPLSLEAGIWIIASRKLNDHLLALPYKGYRNFIIENIVEIVVVSDDIKLSRLFLAPDLLDAPRSREKFCRLAAQHGRKDLLHYAHENGFPWESVNLSDYAMQAAKNGRLHILKYLHENGASIKYLLSSAAEGGSLEVLKYILENDGVLHGVVSRYAALGGNLVCLKYLHEKGCPWHDNTCAEAALGGHLECLSYAFEHGAPWDKDVCSAAAQRGHLECLQYAHENGCPWNADTCAAAAGNGQLDCLKYAHENGCPWDENTCRNAAKNGYLDCLKYAHENGCAISKKTNFGYFFCSECLEYLDDHGDCVDSDCNKKDKDDGLFFAI